MNDLKSELSGNLEDCLLALLEPSDLYDAKCLRRAMRVSVDQTTVILNVTCHSVFPAINLRYGVIQANSLSV